MMDGSGWMLELRAYTAWLIETVARADRKSALTCGKGYELMLLRGEKVLSYTGDAEGQTHALAEVAEIDESRLGQIAAFLNRPTHELAAVELPERRVLLLMPAAGPLGGEGLGIIPRVDRETILRVLDRSFSTRVCRLTPCRASTHDTPSGKESEEAAVEQLIQNGLRLLDGSMGASRELTVRDRRQMSLYLCAMGDLLGTFLDGYLPGEAPSSFPIAYPMHGVFCPARAAWMLLCFAVGLRRTMPSAKHLLRNVSDHERLLPMVEITAGNRTRLPEEWQECLQMAERLGMFFDIRRTRSSVLVRLCPLIPASEREFAIRTVPLIEL